MASDYDEYHAALEEFAASGVEDEEVARANWEFAREYEIWPYNTTVLTPEVIADQLKVSVDTGIIEPETGELSFEDMVHTEILQMAQEYLGGEVTKEDIESGDIPEPAV
jgi:hypothetical protein